MVFALPCHSCFCALGGSCTGTVLAGGCCSTSSCCCLRVCTHTEISWNRDFKIILSPRRMCSSAVRARLPLQCRSPHTSSAARYCLPCKGVSSELKELPEARQSQLDPSSLNSASEHPHRSSVHLTNLLYKLIHINLPESKAM